MPSINYLNLVKVMKDKLLVTTSMKHFPIHQYVHNLLKGFGLGRPQHVFSSSLLMICRKVQHITIVFPGLGMCIEINFMLHLFYGCTMSHSTEINFCMRMGNIFILSFGYNSICSGLCIVQVISSFKCYRFNYFKFTLITLVLAINYL